MAVIALPNLAPRGTPGPLMSWELRSITALNRSPLNGVATTLERTGAAWSATLKYEFLAENERARMQQFLANCRGHGSRFYVPYYGWTNRGSFSAPELLNSIAATTGWGVNSTAGTLTTYDGRLRYTQTAFTTNPQARQTGVTVTQHAPYALRALALHGRGSTQMYRSYLSDSAGGESASSAGAGMRYAWMVPRTTSMDFVPTYNEMTNSGLVGDYFEIGSASAGRCALVDNGPNLLLQASQLATTWSKTGLTLPSSNNTDTSPDGTLTAETVGEDTSAGDHYLSQSVTVSSSAADYSLSVSLKASSRTWAYIQLNEGTGGTSVYAFINLSTGAVGTTSTGANWTALRTAVVAQGTGWYRLSITARKTNAATSLTAIIGVATGDNVASYTGASLAIAAWGASLAQSSVPVRLTQTTSAASTGTSQTGGALYLKGLPASTVGLLVSGDLAEVVTNMSSQLIRDRSSLDSDAAGLGYFEFEAPIRVSPLDNAAVIIRNPLCRMMLDSNTVKWTEHSGGFCDLEFTAVEDTYP